MVMFAAHDQMGGSYPPILNRRRNPLLRKLINIIYLASAFTIATTAHAQTNGFFQKPYPELAALQQTCKVGVAATTTGPAKAGETQLRVAGVTTVSAAEAKCVIDTYANSVLVIDAASENWIIDSFPMGWAARPGSNNEIQREVERVMSALTNKRDRLPIIVYCHHVRCGYSPVVAGRLREAGYGPVLWMREGIDVWRSAGYPTAKEPSRWLRQSLSKVPAWQACFDKQQLPTTGSDYEKVTEQMMSKCAAEEAAYRAQLEPFFLVSQVEGSVASTRKAIAMAGPTYDRFLAEKSQRDEDERAAKSAVYRAELQRKRGVGVPAQERVPGYEMCFVAVDSPDYKRFVIYSDIYPAEIGILGLQDLRTFNLINESSERGIAFIDAIRLPDHLVQIKVRYGGINGCIFYRTRAEADADRASKLQQPGGRNLAYSWRPQ